jgi:ligand-binding sensor domain-containing protein
VHRSGVAAPLFLLTAVLALADPGAAQTWKLFRPSTTGIPGEEVRVVRFAPDGKVWVGARWIFWGEGGFGMLERRTQLWSTISNANGTFLSAFPNDLAWAADGSAWIATDDGLVHWDQGVQTNYTTANAPFLHNVMRSVDVGPDGHVWINNTHPQTTQAALFEFDGTTWKSYRVGEQLPWAPPWNQLTDVMVDHLGHVWVANDVLNGVAEYDGVTWTLHGENVTRFGEIREDTAGNIWLRAGVGGGNAFAKFDRVGFTVYPVPTTPTSIGIDDDGTVYLGDWLGTIRKTTNFGASFTTYLTGLNHVFEIEPDPASTDVWVGTPGAVGRFTATGFLEHDYNTYNTGIGDYFIDRFAVDRQGFLWSASGETGLTRFDGLRWRNWGNHNAGAEPYPFAGNEPMGTIHIDRNGTGWMGGNGIARWNPTTGEFDGFWNWQNNPGMGVTLFTHFAEDAQGRLFAATQYGAIMRFNGNLWEQEAVSVYAPSGFPGMQSDSLGDVWIAGWHDVWHWNGAQWSKVVLPNPNYFFDLGGINVLEIGPDDVKWFGTNDGLVRWDGVAFTRFSTENSPLPAKQVAGIDVRADGLLALTSLEFGAITPFPNGVAIVNGDIAEPASWTTWSYGTSPLPHYQLGECAFDAEGNLWVSALSEAAAVLLHPAQRLSTSTPIIAASIGGGARFALDAGASAAGRSYALLGSFSGTSPGIPLPGGSILPLKPDPFTALSLNLPGAVGTFNGAGRTETSWTLPPIAEAVGLSMHFAWVRPDDWSTSNAVSVRFSP